MDREDQSSSILLTGEGASLIIFDLIPTPGRNFASAKTLIEQIANDLVETYKNILSLHRDSY